MIDGLYLYMVKSHTVIKCIYDFLYHKSFTHYMHSCPGQSGVQLEGWLQEPGIEPMTLWLVDDSLNPLGNSQPRINPWIRPKATVV